MSLGSVLVVDDDDALRFALKKALRRLGFTVDDVSNGSDAVARLHSAEPPDAALLDLRMHKMSGLDVLKRVSNCPTKIIVLTGHGTVQAAVEAMRLGAFSFLEKPVDAEELAPLLQHAIGERRRAKTADPNLAPPLIGVSDKMDEVRRFIDTVGPTDETVAIYGETGTGKEVVARHLHLSSARSGPFVAMNAACVPRDLFESELFGHKRGAFTGATSDRAGLFREANGGTLFIDELAELPTESQAKLLRTLETKTVRAVGGQREEPVDARIIAATNRDLWQDVSEGRFREDLYFRLQVFPIMLAPLRDRSDDVLPLAKHLLERLGASATLSDEAIRALRKYTWPGNVRELLNVLRRASLFAREQDISGDLMRKMIAASVFGHAGTTSERYREPGSEPGTTDLATIERRHIERVLAECDGNVTKAASALGIDRRTLQRKLKGYQ